MRTNIDIDDALLAEAMAATGLNSKRKVVEAGLKLLTRRKRQAAARKLLGRIRWEGDLPTRPIARMRTLIDSSVWIGRTQRVIRRSQCCEPSTSCHTRARLVVSG